MRLRTSIFVWPYFFLERRKFAAQASGNAANQADGAGIRAEPVQRDRAVLEASVKSGMVPLIAEPRRLPRIEDHKTKFPPPDEQRGLGSSAGISMSQFRIRISCNAGPDVAPFGQKGA